MCCHELSPYVSAYAASKATVLRFTESLAADAVIALAAGLSSLDGARSLPG